MAPWPPFSASGTSTRTVVDRSGSLSMVSGHGLQHDGRQSGMPLSTHPDVAIAETEFAMTADTVRRGVLHRHCARKLDRVTASPKSSASSHGTRVRDLNPNRAAAQTRRPIR